MDHLEAAVLASPQSSGQGDEIALGVGLDHARIGPKPARSQFRPVLFQVYVEQAAKKPVNPSHPSLHHHRLAVGQGGKRRQRIARAEVVIPERQEGQKVGTLPSPRSAKRAAVTGPAPGNAVTGWSSNDGSGAPAMFCAGDQG